MHDGSGKRAGAGKPHRGQNAEERTAKRERPAPLPFAAATGKRLLFRNGPESFAVRHAPAAAF